MKTQILPAQTSEQKGVAVALAAELLRSGEIVALPTETVYGLAADAFNVDAVLKVFSAKERPRFDPLIVHLPGSSSLEQVASGGSSLLRALAEKFWPGPLTIVLPRRPGVPDIVTAGLETVAVRVSEHPVFAQVIEKFGRPIAAPSANRFGRISPTSAQHVIEELDGLIPLVVDAGPTSHGLESTIVMLRNGRLEILRRGPITLEQLSEFGAVALALNPVRPEAPGQLASHYAPETPLVLVDDASSYVPPSSKRCGLLKWNPSSASAQFAEVRELSPQQEMREAAANLFRYLRELDRANLDLIVAEKVPETGLGAAIMDRLRRAAAK